MPLSTITATLDSTLRCTINELCSQQTNNLTPDASISFTTLLTAGSTLLATIYAAAASSLTLSSIKLYSFYNKHNLIQANQLDDQFNSTTTTNSILNSMLCNRTHHHQSTTSPTQSEIVSITGALIVFTVLLSTVLLTHLFDAIDDFTRKCCKYNLPTLIQLGVGKNVGQLFSTMKQLLLDLLITIVLKSSLLTSLFVDEKSLKLNQKLNYDPNDRDSYEQSDDEEDRLEELLSDDEFFSKQRKWSTWFAGQLRKRLAHS